MKLWKRAAGALKDKNSIYLASLIAAWPRGSTAPNKSTPLEAFIIKATSHDENTIDYKSAQRVFAALRHSPATIKPFQLALSTRMEKTRSWVVALKGLILMHGVFCCNVPGVHRIGRLPFDLANFRSSRDANWAHDAFVRAYFSFLDHRSSLLCQLSNSRGKCGNRIEDELKKLVKLQNLLDCLLQVKPQGPGMRVRLIAEAMDSVVIEIFEIYSRICSGVANVLLTICTASKSEATLALKVVHKATTQGDELTDYFHHCRRIGVLNAIECPQIEKIPEEDIREIERIINGSTAYNNKQSRQQEEEEKEVVVKEVIASTADKGRLRTIITDKWEVFDDEEQATVHWEDDAKKEVTNPFVELLDVVPQNVKCCNNEMPDLITF